MKRLFSKQRKCFISYTLFLIILQYVNFHDNHALRIGMKKKYYSALFFYNFLLFINGFNSYKIKSAKIHERHIKGISRNITKRYCLEIF